MLSRDPYAMTGDYPIDVAQARQSGNPSRP